MITRSYSDLRRLDSFEDRFNYLKLGGGVGDPTFGFDRILNQQFYRSTQWKNIRNHVIARDLGRDLGVDGYDIYDRIYIHHMNPMTVEDVENGADTNLDPEFLITTTHITHNAIHYGNDSSIPRQLVVRTPGDTAPWRR